MEELASRYPQTRLTENLLNPGPCGGCQRVVDELSALMDIVLDTYHNIPFFMFFEFLLCTISCIAAVTLKVGWIKEDLILYFAHLYCITWHYLPSILINKKHHVLVQTFHVLQILLPRHNRSLLLSLYAWTGSLQRKGNPNLINSRDFCILFISFFQVLVCRTFLCNYRK